MSRALVIDQLARAAERAPQAPLLPARRGEAWQRLSNACAWAQSGAVASWLIAQGFGPGGRSLTVPAGDTPERAVLLLGALRAGAQVVEGPSAVEFAVLAHCSIDAAVAERRLHIDARTPARHSSGSQRCHGDFTTIAEAVGD
jgi:acyl-CoA synthetase (AMP-forming)/AMP-acid ligase II